jgi:hypothetical protein
MPAGVSAYTALANTTLSSTASQVLFSSINGSYRDLVIVVNSAISSGTANLFIQFNSDGGNNYSFVTMYGTGNATWASQAVTTAVMYAGYGTTDLSTEFKSNHQINILDYSATDKHKPVLFRTNHSDYQTHAAAGRWASTSAITSVVIKPTSSTFAAGSSFSLFGVSA